MTLRDSEARFRALAEATFDALILHEDRRVVEVNDEFVRTFGYARDEVVGRDAVEFSAAPESAPAVSEYIKRRFEGPYEATLRRRDGSTFPAELRAKNITYGGRNLRVVAIRDLTERKESEEALRSAERQLRTITDAVPALIAYVDRGGRFRLNNRAYETWFGVSGTDVTGRHMRDVLGPGAWEKIRPRVERALAGEGVAYEDLLPYKGGPRWVSVSYTPSFGPGGDVRGFVVLATDITERKAAEQALRVSEARSALAQQAGGVGIFDWDFATGRSVWTREQEAIYGLAPGGFAGTHRHWLECVHPEDRAAMQDTLHRWLGGRRRENAVEYRIVRPGGEVRWIINRGVATYDRAGKPVRVIGTTIDITDQRLADQALRNGEARLRAIIDTAVDAIITIREQGTIESANAATERMFGYPVREIIGRNVSVLMPEPYRSQHDAHLARYLSTGVRRAIGTRREVLGLRKDGTTFPLELSVSEFTTADGHRMFTAILHDVSERRRLEREILDAATAEQRRIGQELHDGLCQQLAGVAFTAEILARRLQAESPSSVPRIRELAAEIDQAITLARKLAHGLHPVEVHADSLPSALADLARKVSSTFGVTCRFRESGHCCVPDNTVATHLYRIAQEAVSNALRHGKAGRIDLTLRAHEGHLSLSIADDGAGFPPGAATGVDGADRPGIGLKTMAYRSKVIGATLELGAGARGGVVVTCSVAPATSANRTAAQSAGVPRRDKPSSGDLV